MSEPGPGQLIANINKYIFYYFTTKNPAPLLDHLVADSNIKALYQLNFLETR